MRTTAVAAILLATVSAGPADAAAFCAGDWYRQAEALMQSLFGGRPPDREVIAPPPNIDPQMALVPPHPQGTMRIIIPPAAAGRRREWR